MTTEQFAYWLQGFSEINGAPPCAEQWAIIKDHLQTCFVKVTDRHNIFVQNTIHSSGIDEQLKKLNQRRYGVDELTTPPTVTC